MNTIIYFISLFICDLVGICISNKFSLIELDSESYRWFFIHFMVNIYVVYLTLPSVILAFTDNISNFTWTPDAYSAFWCCLILHFYHYTMFKLSPADRIHHTLMCFVCGGLSYYQKTLLSNAALFFISGLPGAIDYFILWLVKLGYISVFKQKKTSLVVNNLIRCPGCCFIALRGVPEIIQSLNGPIDILSVFSLIVSNMLLFWNGVYYNFITTRDFYLRFFVNKYE